MKKSIMVFVLSLLGIIFAQTLTVSAADKVGDTFEYDEMRYEVTVAATAQTNGEVTLTYCDEFRAEVIIPEEVTHEGQKYTVTKISLANPMSPQGDRDFCFSESTIIVIPATVREITDDQWDVEGALESITFNCPFSAIENMDRFLFSQMTLGCEIYVPADDLAKYQNKFEKDARLVIYDRSDLYEGSTRYDGMKVAAIGDESVVPKYFRYDEMYYEIIDESKHTVKLIGGSGNKSYSEDVISTGCLTIPEKVYCKDVEFTVTQLGTYSLVDINCAVRMPDTITKLEKRVFCNDIVAIYMSDGLTSLPSEMFCGENLPAVSYIKLPENLKKIPRKAFYECRKLRGIVIPAGVEAIGSYAFYKNVKSIYMMGAVPQNTYRSVRKLKNTTYYIADEYVEELESVLAGKLGKAKVAACDFDEIESITLNQDTISLSTGDRWRLKAQLAPKGSDYRLVWVSNTWGITVTQGGTVKNVGNLTRGYDGDAIYVFDALSGEYALCRLVE